MNIKRRVNNLVNKWGTRDPKILCKYLKIKIIYKDLGEIKGFYTKCLRRKFIFVNENLDELSQKIVIAHELGHALLHGKAIIQMKGYFMSCKNSTYEKEANLFAAELIIDVKEESREYLDKPVIDSEVMEELVRLKWGER